MVLTVAVAASAAVAAAMQVASRPAAALVGVMVAVAASAAIATSVVVTVAKSAHLSRRSRARVSMTVTLQTAHRAVLMTVAASAVTAEATSPRVKSATLLPGMTVTSAPATKASHRDLTSLPASPHLPNQGSQSLPLPSRPARCLCRVTLPRKPVSSSSLPATELHLGGLIPFKSKQRPLPTLRLTAAFCLWWGVGAERPLAAKLTRV